MLLVNSFVCGYFRTRNKPFVLEINLVEEATQKERHEKIHADTVVIVSVNPCLQTDKRKTRI